MHNLAKDAAVLAPFFTIPISNVMYVTVNKHLVSFQTYLAVLSRLCQREVYKGCFLITNIAVGHMSARYGFSVPDI